MYKISDYPEIQNNFYLTGKNCGASKKLLGNVSILTVFVKQRENDWSEDTKNRYYKCMRNATAWLEKEAKRYGARLKINCVHLETSVSERADARKGFELLKNYFHTSSMQKLHTYYEQSLNVDEIPIIIAFEREGRSFAYKQCSCQKETVQEQTVIFFNKNSRWMAETIAHELLHQFGAADYYYPDSVKAIARRYFGKSLMLDLDSPVLDDLSAYVVGWKDTISAASYWFLRETNWMTMERSDREIDLQWKSS